MAGCRLPYEIQSKQPLKTVLETIYIITLEQRNFMWTKDQYVYPMLVHAYDKCCNGEQEWLGQVMILYEKHTKKQYLYDAQHRITVFILALIAIANESSKESLRETILNKISKRDNEDDTDSMDMEGAELLQRIGGKRISNLRSEYDYDLKALNRILQNIDTEDIESKIKPAYEATLTFIKTLAEEERTKFYKFIFNDIFCDLMTINEWDFVPDVFEKINNIKMPLPLSVTAKNKIIEQLGREHIPSLRVLFDSLKTKCETYEDIIDMNHTLHLAYCFHAKRWIEYSTFSKNPVCLKEPSVESYHDFVTTVNRILDLLPMIRNHLNYPLLDRLTSGHEIVTTYLIPMLYVYGESHLTEIISVLLASVLYIKTGQGKLNLNSKKFQVKIIGDDKKMGIINKVISMDMPWSETIRQLKLFFREIGDVSEDDFIKKWVTSCEEMGKRDGPMNKAILCYLWSTTNSHETIPDYSKVDLEHILPQSQRSTLGKAIDRLGNLTLFVGPNSDQVRGNRSLQDKPFLEKLPMYLKSNIEMTRDLAIYSSGFNVEQIEVREQGIIKELYRVINRVL